MNEKRAERRLLQPALLEEIPGAGPHSPKGVQPGSAAAHPLSARCRSTCVVQPPVGESIGDGAGDGRSGAGASGGGSSPAACSGAASARRNTYGEDAGVRLGSSPPGNGDPESHHLSVPLTLLSLHNGGARHTPRGSRDTSPMVSLIASRECSFTSLPDGLALSCSGGAGSVGSPPRRISSGNDGPTLAPALSSPSTSRPLPSLHAGRPSVVGTGAAPVGAAAASDSCLATAPACGSPLAAVGAAPAAAGSAAAGASGGSGAAGSSGGGGGGGSGSSGGGGGSITVPGHLCSQRPPTPLCREDDLMASLRHLASPTRRRSRFASAADSSLLAAAAAAIAAEEAGQLDSPPGSFTAGSGGGGGGSSSGGVGGCSLRGSLVLQGETPALRPLVLGGMEPAPWGAASPSGGTSRRCGTQLGTVPEEPPAGAGAGSGRSTPRGAPSTPGGSGAAGGSSPAAGRRQRCSGAAGSDVGPASQDGESGHSGPLRSVGGGGGVSASGAAAGAGTAGGPADDALSSFMHSFEPGSPAARCPTPAGSQPAALLVGSGGASRVSAR